ncbi:Nodulation efficiency protein NfeD [Thermanaeromonas toyohensis ToBE]|uniref:Nodulation efficiency protein NfeD n=1 Tax=Thermanaeromonas toyohensis ToBE TaxID=698762 RepID=A0A1W1W134_9FIRM|nr:nodulation protein NfeD [Thermanaeromonas toyohensis]SMB99071.1 Nodulation efficiency protein NfeD [Thermanaeromonas toyohensis ToBE]
MVFREKGNKHRAKGTLFYVTTRLVMVTILTLVLFSRMTIAHSSEVERSSPCIYVLRVEGPIVPVTADYIQKGIREAYEDGACLLILELSTPGGLYSSTQKIVESILNAPLPVVVHVCPAGAWAGSAGTFITIAAHVAAMAPGSRIGAAHPVAVGSEGELPETHKQKIAQDAAAWVRSIAECRGRDPREAELAVLESKSFSDSEALKAGLIDLRATTREELLQQLEGKKVKLINGEEVTLQVIDKPIHLLAMTSAQRLLLAVSDPNIAYLFMTLGTLGLLVELYHPGAIFPGVVGGISLLLGLYALGSLEARFSGLLLLLLGLILMAAEVFVVSHGLLLGGGLISFILGSILLFNENPFYWRLNLVLVTVTSLILASFLTFLLGAAIKAQRRKVTTGRESLIGTQGVALTELKPEGTILVEGERWKAESTEPVSPGERVVVTGIEGLKLKVKRQSKTDGETY